MIPRKEGPIESTGRLGRRTRRNGAVPSRVAVQGVGRPVEVETALRWEITRVILAGLRATIAVIPAVIGWIGHSGIGVSMSFGAYRAIASNSDLSKSARPSVLAASAAVLSFGAAAGSLCASSVVRLFLGATAIVLAWAVSEVAGGPLRMPLAMTVLAFLLSSGNLGPGLCAGVYSTSFAAGVCLLTLFITISSAHIEPELRPEGFVKLLSWCGAARIGRWRLQQRTRATGIRSRISGMRCGCITGLL